MPIYNNLFGVWKLLVYKSVDGLTDKAYVVKSAKESVQQEVNPEFFVQGTALPLIQNIGGGTAELDITAPLLLKAHPWNWSPTAGFQRELNGGLGDDLHDGFTLWCRLMGGASGLTAGFFNGLYSADPGFVIKNAGLDISTTGAVYNIGFRGDTNFLGDESGSNVGWRVIDASDPNWNTWTNTDGIMPWPRNPLSYTELCPLRVATFYDIIASADVAGSTLLGYVEKLNINLAIQTKQTNVVGQQTQRPIMGISGVDITFGGTLIYNTRQPLGYLFPWQAMNDGTPPASVDRVPAGYETFGGTGKYSSFSLKVGLRNGIGNPSVLPLLPYLNVDKAVFNSSSLDISNDFIRTTFEGKGWISNPNFVTTDPGTPPAGAGVPM